MAQLPQSEPPINVKLLTRILTAGATLSVGILSYAGAIASGFMMPFAVFAFFITAVVEIQVFNNNIEGAAAKLLNFFSEFSLKNVAYLLVSVLAAIGFGFNTLNAAVALLPASLFVIAAQIAIVSGLAFAFIVYNTLTSESLNTFKDAYNKNKKLAITLSIMTALLAYLTGLDWSKECYEGLSIMFSTHTASLLNIPTAIASIVGFNLFLFKNAFEALASDEAQKAFNFGKKYTDFKELFDKKPFDRTSFPYYMMMGLAWSTAMLLQALHSGCQALIAGRTSCSAFLGTVLDMFCDANANSVGCDHHIFDQIVDASKYSALRILQVLIVPIDSVISRKSLKESWDQCSVYVAEFMKEEHDHHKGCEHDQQPAAVVQTDFFTASEPYLAGVQMRDVGQQREQPVPTTPLDLLQQAAKLSSRVPAPR